MALPIHVHDAKCIFDTGVLFVVTFEGELVPQRNQLALCGIVVTHIAQRQRALIARPEEMRFLFDDELEQFLRVVIATRFVQDHAAGERLVEKFVVADVALVIVWRRCD